MPKGTAGPTLPEGGGTTRGIEQLENGATVTPLETSKFVTEEIGDVSELEEIVVMFASRGGPIARVSFRRFCRQSGGAETSSGRSCW